LSGLGDGTGSGDARGGDPQRIGLRTWLRASRQGSTYLGLTLIALMWLSVLAYLHGDRRQAFEISAQRTGTLARAFAESTQRTLAEVDKTLIILRTAYEANPAEFHLPAFTRNAYFLNDVTLQVALIGRDGMLVSTNLGPVDKPLDLSDREHFQAQKNAAADRLFISKPVLGRASGKWSIQMTRRLAGPDGAFAGVLVASIDPRHLERFYETMELGEGAAVTVIGDDGVIRARGSRSAEIVLGRSIAGSELFRSLQAAPTGTSIAVSPIDGLRRLTSFKSLTDFPVKVMVSVPLEEVQGGNDGRWTLYLTLASLLTLGVLAAMLRSIGNQVNLDRALDALRSSEARASAKSVEFQATLENISQGIMMIDANRRVAVVNRQAIRLLGLPEEYLTSRPFFDEVLAYQWSSGEFGSDGASLEPKVLNFIRSGGATGEVTVYERTRPNGAVLEIRTLPLPDGGVVRTYSDVTERSQNAAALAEAKDRAEAATRARTAFLAMMSHEIRTPLNGVIGMAGLLAETELDGEQRRYTGTLRDSAEHLLQVIDDVLDFSKLEADRGAFEEVQFDLEKTIDSMLGIVAPRAQEKGLFLGALVAPDIPDMVVGDAGALRQILLNLVGNGVKFTAAGSVIVGVDMVAAEDAGSDRLTLRFSVRDTGIGIPPEAAPALFQEFSQLDGSIARRFGGTGLGLAISKHLVERLGGSIGMTSTPGEGATFTFTMPLGRAAGASRSAPAAFLSGQRWLVLARDARIRTFHAGLLANAGACVDVAADLDAAAGLLAAAEPPYASLLVDDQGEQIDAAALGDALQRSPLKTPERFVLATRLPARPGQDHALGWMFDQVLGTPVSRQALRDCLLTQPAPTGLPWARLAPVRSRKTVLLAEDNRTNRMVVESLLGKLGYLSICVEDGRQAIERVRQGGIDCVLMDLMMPEMDGFAAALAIRQLPEPFRSVPIVALTANVLTADLEAARAAGMDDFATKPITRDKLGQIIAKALAGQPEQPAATAPALADAASDLQAFDEAALTAIMSELDPASVGVIFCAFLEDSAVRLALIAQPGVDPIVAGREAHALKSAAATFGLAKLAHLSSVLESGATTMGVAGLQEFAARMNAAFAEGRAGTLAQLPGRLFLDGDPPSPRALVA
jgi:signal transduction histidine kinase/CheY-like chemotaxis protein